MSPTEQFGQIDEKIRIEAADWFARMRGPAAESSRPAFDDWYATPAHARAYEQLVGRWEQSAFIGNSRTGRERQLSRATLVTRHPALSAAAALIGIVGVSALVFVSYNDRAPTADVAVDQSHLRYQTGTQAQDVALSDGSRVMLDKASLLLVSYSPTRRALRLERGRARFRPVRDPARPFVVVAGRGEVVADGTVFDVAFEGSTAIVNAIDGTVAVRSRGQTLPARLVLASQQIVVAGNAPLPEPKRALPTATSWLPRMIALDHTSLADAALQVGRDAQTKILFVDDASALQITGTFKSGDTEGLARAAEAMFRLRRVRDSDGTIVLARSAQTPPK